MWSWQSEILDDSCPDKLMLEMLTLWTRYDRNFLDENDQISPVPNVRVQSQRDWIYLSRAAPQTIWDFIGPLGHAKVSIDAHPLQSCPLYNNGCKTANLQPHILSSVQTCHTHSLRPIGDTSRAQMSQVSWSKPVLSFNSETMEMDVSHFLRTGGIMFTIDAKKPCRSGPVKSASL